jgi:hypothetical protein
MKFGETKSVSGKLNSVARTIRAWGHKGGLVADRRISGGSAE